MKKIEEEIHQKQFKDAFERVEVNIAFTSAWQHNRFTRILKEFDISTQQFNILRILKGQYPNIVPLKLLTSRMIDKMSNTSRLIEKLKTKGLVHREICAINRRQVDIVITESGLKMIANLTSIVNEARAVDFNLTKEEAIQLSFLLDKLRNT